MENFIRRSKGALTIQDVSKKKYTYKVSQGEKLTDLEVLLSYKVLFLFTLLQQFSWFFRLGQTDVMVSFFYYFISLMYLLGTMYVTIDKS